jgi:hypothetical protein
MYLELAEGETLSGHRRKKPVRYLPHPHQPKVMCREDHFDQMSESDFYSHLNEYAQELNEDDLQELAAGRKERKAAKFEAKMAKKAAKTDKKQSKADLRRAKGAAKETKAEAKRLKAESGEKTTFSDVIGGITDVAGAATGVIGAIKGTGGAEAEQAPAPMPTPSFFEKNKMPILIGGGILVAGLIFMSMRKKPSAA